MQIDVPTAQVIAYATLTIVSIVVASIAVNFSYRANNGWEPVIVITRQTVGRKDVETPIRNITCHFKVWNRRKYPIVLNGAKFAFDNFKVEGIADWNTFEGRSYAGFDTIIEPAKHFKATAEVNAEATDLLNQPFTLAIYIFDPIKNEKRVVEVTGGFMTWKFESSSRPANVAET